MKKQFIFLIVILFSVVSNNLQAITLSQERAWGFHIVTPKETCEQYNSVYSSKLSSELFARLAFHISHTQTDIDIFRQYQLAGKCAHPVAYEEERQYYTEKQYQNVVWRLMQKYID